MTVAVENTFIQFEKAEHGDRGCVAHQSMSDTTIVSLPGLM